MRLLAVLFYTIGAGAGFSYAFAVANGRVAPPWLVAMAFIALGIINVFHAINAFREF